MDQQTLRALVNIKYVLDTYGIASIDPATNVGVSYSSGGTHILTVQQVCDPRWFENATYNYNQGSKDKIDGLSTLYTDAYQTIQDQKDL